MSSFFGCCQLSVVVGILLFSCCCGGWGVLLLLNLSRLFQAHVLGACYSRDDSWRHDKCKVTTPRSTHFPLAISQRRFHRRCHFSDARFAASIFSSYRIEWRHRKIPSAKEITPYFPCFSIDMTETLMWVQSVVVCLLLQRSRLKVW